MSFYDRKKYTLYHESNPGVEIEEPVEWKEDEKTFARNLELHGIAISHTDVLTFEGDGKLLLSSILEDYGINANVRMLVRVRDSETDEWKVNYSAYVDYEGFIESHYQFKVKFNADPLLTKFKSKLKATVELERLTNLEGESILPLNKDEIFLDGRDILLTNKFESNRLIDLRTSNNETRVVPVGIKEIGDVSTGIANVHTPVIIDNHGRTDVNTGYIEEMFHDVNETGSDVNLKLNLKIKQSVFLTTSGSVTNVQFKVRVAIFSGGYAPVFNREVIVGDEYNGSWQDFPRRLDIVDYKEITLAENESCSLQYYMKVTGSGYVDMTSAYLFSCPGAPLSYYDNDDKICSFVNEDGEWEASYEIKSMTVQEDSSREGSTSPIIKIYEFAKRLNDIILGAEFRSSLFAESYRSERYNDDGDLADIGLLHGMWVRGLTENSDRYKPISTSISDFIQSVDAIYPIGVDVYNGQLIMEARNYFYQKFVSIDLGEVVDFELSLDAKSHASLITVGYEKAGGYEEEQGLDEYNRETEYNTVLDKNTNELKLISKYRADLYGLEDVRRDNPNVGLNVELDKDSKFDDHIWMLDTNRVLGQDNIVVSDWNKRFAQAPKGVYSPDTAKNIWLSPINILLRHGSWLKSPLLHYLDSWIKFNFSEGNSNLITKLIGGNEYYQSDGIQVKDFERSENKARIGKFKAPVTWEQLNGYTKGKRNVYGLVSLTYKGKSYKGHIMKVVQKYGIGEWELKIFS